MNLMVKIYEIERRTADQNEDGEWMEQRRKLKLPEILAKFVS
jgi:hypothetical protein